MRPPCTGSSASRSGNVFLGADRDIFNNTLLLPVPVNDGANCYIISRPVTYFVEPGSTPYLFLAGYGINPNESATATITGYLVAIP
jgi:hypothetical protein